jgi:dephospho-CoA kinase
MRIKLVGISGTNGAGKDTVGQILSEQYGWLFVSVTDLLREELKKRGLPIERANMRMVSAEWRRQYGLGVLIDKAFEIYKSHQKDYQGLAVSSLRNPGEADEVHHLGGQVIWVDADPKVRYERVFSRQRSAEDKKTYDQFLKEEQDEMEHSGDHHTLSGAGVKAKADIFLDNSGDLKAFTKKINQALNL